MKDFFKKNWPLVLIIFLAGFLRLWKISGYMEFLGDQGRDVVIVRRFLKKGDLMFIGPQTSIGNMYLGPWYYYLIAPALFLFNYSPVGPAIMVALLSLASLYLLWKIGRDWFDQGTGFLAALIFGLSPVAVYYSIFSWNPNIAPLFSLLSVYFLWQIWEKNKFKNFVWLGICLAMVLNTHYLALLLFPGAGLFLFLKFYQIRKNKTSRKEFLKKGFQGLAAFFLLMLPLLLFDLKHDFVNFKAVWQFFTVRQTTVNLKAYKGILIFPRIVNQFLANLFLRKDYWPSIYWFFPFLAWGFWKLRKDKKVIFLLIFLLIGFLGLANYKQHVYAHYFGFLWPIGILFLAACLRKINWLGLVITAFLSWLMVFHWHGWQKPNFQLKRAENVAQFISEEAGDQEFGLALIAEQNYDPPYRYFLEEKADKLVNLHEKIPDQLFVICEPWGKINCDPIGHPLWEIAAFGWSEIDREWELEGIRLFKLIHFQEKG